MQVCADCGAVQYPPREVRGGCLSEQLSWRAVDPSGTLLVSTTLHHSNDLYFRERLPWRVGTVRMSAGPRWWRTCTRIAPTARRCGWRSLDRSGQAVMIALPERNTPNMEDDKTLRETSW